MSHPSPYYATIQCALAPVNLAGHLVGKATKTNTKLKPLHEPFYYILFSALNTILVSSYIYCLFHVFHDMYFGFLVAGFYVFSGILIGSILGPLDDMWVS
jgi:hypothetical protein